MRPSDEKFMDNTNFQKPRKYEFRPIVGNIDLDEHGLSNSCGGSWLGKEFFSRIGEKPFSVQTVIQGIMEHQKLWTLH